MELPQPRPFGTEGKKPTHDFLSLYGDTSFHHPDPRPSSHGFYLKTHDFLQPLERVGKSNSIGDDANETISAVEKPSSIEHALPGGIGTYSISHISNFGRAVKPERPSFTDVQSGSTDVRSVSAERSCGEVNKANGNFGVGAFTLWDESVVKEKVGEGQPIREPLEKKSVPFPPLASCSVFSSLPASKQNQAQQKSLGFLEMMRSMKGLPEEDDDDDEDFVKKEVSSQKGDLSAKSDGKGNDQRANTPRSKHSATEQRRRSKINDRFQILRELIPHSDQKRDKASFLLEVIEYIHFLQEKVQKYEAAFPGWNQDSMKFIPWKHSHVLGESIADHSRATKTGAGPGLTFAGKFEENSVASTPAMLANNPVESDNMSPGTPYKTMDHHPGLASKTIPVPGPLQQNTFSSSVARNSGISLPTQRLMSDVENMASRPQPHLWQRPCPTDSDNLNEQEELTVEGGTIRVSSIYSQGLLNSLTQALQSSGVDLSQASISVQIDLGKRANSRPSTTTSSAKDHDDPSSSNRAVAHSRVASSGEDSHQQAQKRLRTANS
ncbi:transcription factor BIM2-like [Magnolia sinica]|uniref:transcription factor BIM2-like n=1 Tax=Magnolia sinica TaxID=86752 RepID=UPI002657CB89|nr:transcription factor BIM2-like [Magnolia sinica]